MDQNACCERVSAWEELTEMKRLSHCFQVLLLQDNFFCFNPLTCMCLFSFHKHFLFWEYSWRTTLVCMWKPYKNIPLLFFSANKCFHARSRVKVFLVLYKDQFIDNLSLSLTHIPENKIVHHVTVKLGSENECPFVRGKGQRRYRYDTLLIYGAKVACDRWLPLHLAFFKHKEKMKWPKQLS